MEPVNIVVNGVDDASVAGLLDQSDINETVCREEFGLKRHKNQKVDCKYIVRK